MEGVGRERKRKTNVCELAVINKGILDQNINLREYLKNSPNLG